MEKADIEAILNNYLKPVLGFALKRCRSNEDAEDLSQEIILKVYKALLVREEVATIRPDGGVNIFHANVTEPKVPENHLEMRNWCGSTWNGNGEHVLWQVGSEWSDFRAERDVMRYQADASRILSLYGRAKTEKLSRDEYAWLAEKGSVNPDPARLTREDSYVRLTREDSYAFAD